jgi:putative peptidoglycan lipid II flippase
MTHVEPAEVSPGLAPGAASTPRVVARHGRLVHRTVLVSALTLVSRVLGYARESAMAAIFGDASTINDALVTAWRVPNLFRRLLGEGALSTSLQTSLTEVDHDRGEDAGRALFLRTMRITTWILLAVALGLMALALVAPDRDPLFGTHWLGEDPAPVRDLTVRLMPYVLFVCLSALASGALQVRGEFKVSSLAPAMLNVVWIAALLALAFAHGWPSAGLATLAPTRAEELEVARILCWAVLIAGALQLAIQVPALRRHGLLGSTPSDFDPRPLARSVLATSAPLALGAAVYQVNVMIDGFMAKSMLPIGGATAYHYASRVQQFPVALIATAATAAIFPSLKALGHTGRKAELRALHDRAQLGVAFLALPACLGLIALSHPICTVLFQHGRYGPEGVARTARALAMLSLSILPTGAIALTSRAYYALGDFKTPVRVALGMLACNTVLNVVFVRYLAFDADGFALATSITGWLNLILLWPGLVRRLGLPPSDGGLTRRVIRIVIATAASASAAYVAQRWAQASVDPGSPTSLRAALALATGLASGVAVFAAASHLLGLEEWRELCARVRARGPFGGGRKSSN